MSKLHPIYVALDSHQYNRAIKAASALPESNVLGKALLAHAYSKAGQRYMSVVTLNKILGGRFCELKHEVDNALEAFEDREQRESKAQNKPEATAPVSSKKGKKGKKKPAPPPKPVVSSSNALDDGPQRDLAEYLDKQPALPDNWEELPPAQDAITDETILGTMAVTLQGLKLPLTAYQLHAWACSAQPNEYNLTKTFSLALNLLAAPRKWTKESHSKLETSVLTHIQTVALQCARLHMTNNSTSSPFPSMLATAWAAQTALWQLDWLPSDDKRTMILPRLAESMAMKLLQQNSEQSQSAEVKLLAMRALEKQAKWSEMLEILEEQADADGESPVVTSEFGVSLTSYQISTEKARLLCKLENYEAAQAVYESLLSTSPDDWICWKGHLDCSLKLDKTDCTQKLVDDVLSKQADAKYPLRGPHLMRVELRAHEVRRQRDDGTLQSLADAIQGYGQTFGPRAACAFSDVESYIELLSQKETRASISIAQGLLDFVGEMRNDNSVGEAGESMEKKERQRKLRAYIFAMKVNHKILVEYVELQDKFFPNWSQLVQEWKGTLSLGAAVEGEITQKEVKPGDDLAIIAVQQLLYQNPGDSGCQLACAALLESAMRHSPDNAYLKFSAINVYNQLNASTRSWDIFQSIGIKHIQLDSCIFTILPFLFEGGMYNEALQVCNALLRFHAGTTRDCGDFASRAMEGGTLSKADEFLVFQREKMNKSLALLDAKGIILDAAPLMATAVPRKKFDDDPIMTGMLGINQGIIGGTDDMGRAKQMITQSHNPFAALSIVPWSTYAGIHETEEAMADNRDRSIWSYQILCKTPVPERRTTYQDARRRGHIHGILMRATLCLHAAKGPKKGKVVKPTPFLEKRTLSLLESVESFQKCLGDVVIDDTGRNLVACLLELARALAVVNSGLPNPDGDSMEQREQRTCSLLQDKAVPLLKQAQSTMGDSVAATCSLLPNYLTSVFALFRMCASICDIYGWGKRKRKTKRCAGAVADVAMQILAIVDKQLITLQSLPETENASQETIDLEVQEAHASLLGADIVGEAQGLVTKARFRTRERVAPILKEMRDVLDSFDVKDD